MYKKNPKKLLAIALTIVFALYLLLLIVYLPKKELAFGITTVFSSLSFLACLYFLLLFKSEKFIFKRFPFYYVTIIYFVLQLIVGLILAIVNMSRFIDLFVIEILVLAAWLIVVLVIASLNQSTNEQTDKDLLAHQQIHTWSYQVTKINDLVSNQNLMAELAKLNDKIMYSDPVSLPLVNTIDESIAQNIGKLKDCLTDEAKMQVLIKKISDMLDERNQMLKINK